MDKKLSDLKRQLEADPENEQLLKQLAYMTNRTANKKELLDAIDLLIGTLNKKYDSRYEVRAKPRRSAPTITIGMGDTNRENRSPNRYDDITKGFSVGSQWIDVDSGEVFLCIDNAEETAEWSVLQNSGHFNFDQNETYQGGPYFFDWPI